MLKNVLIVTIKLSIIYFDNSVFHDKFIPTITIRINIYYLITFIKYKTFMNLKLLQAKTVITIAC